MSKNEIWDVFGEKIICKIKAEETEGRFTVVEETSPAGGIVPPHLHNETDEAVYVVEGRYEFTCGGEVFIASAGDTLFIPRRTPHGFRNIGDGEARLLAVITPAGFEQFFAEIDRLPKNEPPDMEKVAGIGKRLDLELVMPGA